MIESVSRPELPLEHFTLQYEYAKRATQVSNISIEQALMEFTQFWRRVNDIAALKAGKMEWSFDPATPQWQELCDRINNNESADIVAYDLYIRNNNSTETGKEYFGCFRYDLIPQVDDDHGVIKIHFKNRDSSGKGPLSKERQQARLQDLKLMFESIRKNHPEAKVVRSGSWLYNLPSYQRLFPEIFIANMKIEEVPFPRTSGIWGQFLNSEGEVSEKMKRSFLLRVNNAETTDQLLQCFEFRILFPKTRIENFYGHFAIGGLLGSPSSLSQFPAESHQ